MVAGNEVGDVERPSCHVVLESLLVLEADLGLTGRDAESSIVGQRTD